MIMKTLKMCSLYEGSSKGDVLLSSWGNLCEDCYRDEKMF